ncbi:energy-coupling factor transporter transmembrane component T family protein [Apilactobacillus xinyiensis]|uniref:energy-coupling factor transporter transmembrane component T family protein n=1 Tax=Apilactobacillus xinyiensis TaxID=2841032 RepID=UPI001C7D53B9|nr:energy-coupling factor transporter transmembrane component T [Apilactobacillus xinyiensis]
MENFIFGRYMPGNSLVHNLNPAMKILISFYFIVIVFFANNYLTYALLFFLCFISLYLSKIPFGFFLKGIRPLILLIIITVLLQLFFSAGGHIYFSFWIFKITSLGLISAAYIFMRFMLIITISTLLTLTTSPLAISYGIEKILSPLKKIHCPVDTIALMISIALRFVPTLTDEATSIMNAQRSRGVDFGNGNLIKRIKSLIPLLVPLFVSAFNHADELSVAMEARGYSPEMKRTKFKSYLIGMNDYISMMLFFVISLMIIFFRN